MPQHRGSLNAMLLTICIVNWNTRDYLKECLTALYAAPPAGHDMEIIVVDNASSDNSAQMVRSDFPQVTLIANKSNDGYAHGNNQAFRAGKGNWFLLLNPDVIVNRDTLTRCVQHLERNPDVAAVACRLLERDGSTQLSIRGFPDPVPVLCEYLGLAKLLPASHVVGGYRMTEFNYDAPAEVDQPMGSFMMVTRDALREVGDMDETFPIFFNDVDWCYRARRHSNLKIHYLCDATATHYGGGSTRQVRPKMIQESHRSLLRFYEKHYKMRMSRAMFWLIRRAVLLNERRALSRAQREGPVVTA
jgi:GT2 family glycosyltransferase